MAESNDNEREFQVLQTVNSLPEAELLVGLLASRGIEARWAASDAGGQFPNLDLVAGVAILVYEEDLDRAREVLREPEPLANGEEPPGP